MPPKSSNAFIDMATLPADLRPKAVLSKVDKFFDDIVLLFSDLQSSDEINTSIAIQ